MSLTLIVILENILYLHVQIYQNILDEEFDDIDLIFQMVVVFFFYKLDQKFDLEQRQSELTCN